MWMPELGHLPAGTEIQPQGHPKASPEQLRIPCPRPALQSPPRTRNSRGYSTRRQRGSGWAGTGPGWDNWLQSTAHTTAPGNCRALPPPALSPKSAQGSGNTPGSCSGPWSSQRGHSSQLMTLSSSHLQKGRRFSNSLCCFSLSARVPTSSTPALVPPLPVTSREQKVQF